VARTQCVHGLDARFCSICNKVGRPKKGVSHHPPDATLAEILQFLNTQQIRATYGAVADVLGVIPRSMGARLGLPNREASWIVSAETGLPTDYAEHDIHHALRRSGEIINTGGELRKRLAAWRAARQT
jgi:hypothetical protein